MDDDLRETIESASGDDRGEGLRLQLAESLAAAFSAGGQILWVGGYLLGADRSSGESPFEFGDDAAVGLSTVLLIAGELVSGAVAMLVADNRYAAAALVRQLVEVEYLAWAFAEDEEEARAWMRSSKEERQRFWQPRHLRERANGRFRGSDYGEHCGRGGHPSPEGVVLLPGHSTPESIGPIWACDLVMHGLSVWSYALSAAEKVGYGNELADLEETKALSEAEVSWRDGDPLIAQLDMFFSQRPDSGWKLRRRSWIASLLPDDDPAGN